MKNFYRKTKDEKFNGNVQKFKKNHNFCARTESEKSGNNFSLK